MVHTPHRRAMDSSESPVHGQAGGSRYNGHFAITLSASSGIAKQRRYGQATSTGR